MSIHVVYNVHSVCMYAYQCVCMFFFVAVVGEVVPLLKVVMARMLPMLGLAKLDNMQWVFSNG